MASKAQVLPSPYGRQVPRGPRPLRFQTNDPVVLPRSRGWDLGAGLMVAAAAATLLVAGTTYAVFYTAPPRLSETPSAPLLREYVPEADWARVNALKALSAPAAMIPESARVPTLAQSMPATSAGTSEVLIDDSAPGVQETLPQPLENQPSMTPYPNPTTTPPDAIAPSEAPSTGMESAPSTLDDGNPYR